MKAGSILLVKNKGFLQDQIRLHMAFLGKKTKRDYILPYNHADVITFYNNMWVAVGAIGDGVTVRPLDTCLGHAEKYIILEPLIPLSDIDLGILNEYVYLTSEADKRKYQKGNFLAWIGKIKFNLNWMFKGDRKVYCYEYAARCADRIKRWNGNLDWVSIYDLYENPHYIKTQQKD